MTSAKTTRTIIQRRICAYLSGVFNTARSDNAYSRFAHHQIPTSAAETGWVADRQLVGTTRRIQPHAPGAFEVQVDEEKEAVPVTTDDLQAALSATSVRARVPASQGHYDWQIEQALLLNPVCADSANIRFQPTTAARSFPVLGSLI